MIRKTSLYFGAIFATILLLGSTGITQAYAVNYETDDLNFHACVEVRHGPLQMAHKIKDTRTVEFGVWADDNERKKPSFELSYDFPQFLEEPKSSKWYNFHNECIEKAELSYIEIAIDVDDPINHDAQQCMNYGLINGINHKSDPISATNSLPNTSVGFPSTDGIIQLKCDTPIGDNNQMDAKWLLRLNVVYVNDDGKEYVYETSINNTVVD